LQDLTRPERRFTFGEVAELYDRVRPRYPAALVDDLVSLAAIPERARVLEIGCGTGQLTVALASRDFRMLCLEPGPGMAQVARRKLADFAEVEVVPDTFEAWPVEPGAFDLVVSAQAFHWVAPEVRFEKAAEALRPGGSLAVVGNAVVPRQSPVRAAIDAAYAAHAPALLDSAGAMSWYAEGGPIPALFAESARFDPATWRRHPWSQAYTAREYLDLLRTHSDHRLLGESERESLLAAIGQAIDRCGGSTEVQYEAHLYLARVAA
jgi:SAM-dependent methyltransferase